MTTLPIYSSIFVYISKHNGISYCIVLLRKRKEELYGLKKEGLEQGGRIVGMRKGGHKFCTLILRKAS